MVKIGQHSPPLQPRPPAPGDPAPVEFRSPVHPLLPVEVIDRDDLFDRIDPTDLGTAQRPTFDCILLTRSARGVHTVDFVDIPAAPGRLVRVVGGQAQTWDPDLDDGATVVLSSAGTSTPRPWFPGDPCHVDLDDDALATAVALIDALRRHQRGFDGADRTIRLLVSLYDALVALFERSARDRLPTETSELYVAFRAAVERDVTRHRDVAHYASQIGYSERTVTRACVRATGRTAKQVLIDRVVLEAKRLLARTDEPIGAIAEQIGFSEATNFTKFFARHAGVTPVAFRASVPRTGVRR